MKWVKRRVKALFVLLIMLTAAGCTKAPCAGIIEWIDFLKINNIKYYHNDDGTKEVTIEQRGDKLGEVSYMLNGNACTDHVEKNGDAAFLPIGTGIYAMKGYKSGFRVIADNKIYQVNDNPNAATLGDLLDINGRVEKVSLESAEDGSPIGDFSAKAASEFIQELLPLSHIGFDAIYKKIKHESGIFLRVHLQDGTSFRMVYYPKANAFTEGAFGTERLKALIMTQRQQIKAAAGL